MAVYGGRHSAADLVVSCGMYSCGLMNSCAVTLKQFMGCYNENPACPVGDDTCRVVEFEVSGMADKKHEVVKCSTACRKKDKMFFAKTVSRTC